MLLTDEAPRSANETVSGATPLDGVATSPIPSVVFEDDLTAMLWLTGYPVELVAVAVRVVVPGPTSTIAVNVDP